MSYYEPLVYIVPETEEGWSLKTILQKRMLISRTLLSRLKQTDEGIKVNGWRQYINVQVHRDDKIEVRMEQEVSGDIMPQAMPLDILYEDDQLLIVNKEAGLIVHPTHGHYINTLANGVVYYWQQQGLHYRFRPIHRLDQETSGVLAIAKNPYAHHHISEQMKANKVRKEYIALVYGHLADDSGTVNAPIDRDPGEPHKRIVTVSGYPAVTHYKVEKKYSLGSQVRLVLETGRTHQIRVHMQYMGCPLFGDKMYFTQQMCEDVMKINPLEGAKMDRHALHAVKLAFAHPVTRHWMEFEAELPEDMQDLIKALEIL
ncbi:MAG TPA: RluA family pseudouridine synthase [Bacilli bacterium]